MAGGLPAVGSYIPTSTGWLYPSVVIDLCSRRIVGWAPADHREARLVCDSLQQALGPRPLSQGVPPVFHNDRGSQYGSGAFRQLLAANNFRQSMSARANPYHNDWTESFMGTLKAEKLRGGIFIDAHDARTEIDAYILPSTFASNREAKASRLRNSSRNRPLS